MESRKKQNSEVVVSPVELKRQAIMLRRLHTLIDVVYGLMLVRIFMLLPQPTQEQINNKDILGMFADNGTTLLVMLIGIILIIIYWGQSNVQLGYLERVDAKVGIFAIVQVFSLLLYLYFTKLENQTDGDEFTLLMQSIFLSIAGFTGIYSWNYSWKKKYFTSDLTSEESIEISTSFYAEPVVAAITIPLAFIGATYYTIGWLLLIPIGIIFKRRKRKKLAELRNHN